MEKTFSRQIANGTVRVLNAILKVEANSNSSAWAYQPKAPEGLARFKKNGDKK